MKKLFIGLPIQSEMALLIGERWSKDPLLNLNLTLARIKSLADRSSLESLLKEYQSFDFGLVTINCVTLFESRSTAKGVEYIPLF